MSEVTESAGTRQVTRAGDTCGAHGRLMGGEKSGPSP